MLARILSWAPAAALGLISAAGGALAIAVATVVVAGKLGHPPTSEPWLLTTAAGKAVLAVAAAAVAVLAARAWRYRGAEGRFWNAVIALVLGALGGLAAGLAAAVAALVVAGHGGHPPTTEPLSLGQALWALYGPLLAVVGAAMLMIYAWWRRIEEEGFPWLAMSGLIALLALVGVRYAFADQPDPEGPAKALHKSAVERGMGLRHDVVVLVDPGTPAARRLIARARRRPELFTAPRDGLLHWDVATGVAVVGPGREWRLVQPPTPDRAAVARSLAAIAPSDRRAGASAETSALRALASGPAGGWRRGSLRSVALVYRDLPALGHARAALAPDGPPATNDERRAAAAFQVVADRGGSARRERWQAWAARSGGSLTLPGRFADDRQAVDAAEDAATGRATAADRQTAVDFRPRLLFDSEERYRPIDVDAYLAETDDRGYSPHELCRGGACQRIHGPRDLRSGFDELRTAGDIPADVTRTRPTPERIYYHRTDAGMHAYLDYWWFLRFNDSPVGKRYMCLRGLAIQEATCFDHEGDWEGVTVTLRRKTGPRGGAWVGESVTYAGHSWRYRYDWDVLRTAGSIVGTHPLAYSASGSHASYPVGCGSWQHPGTCRQLGTLVPDGRRDGAREWSRNDDCGSCVLELPTDAYGAPALWNAFGGRWGAAACTPGMKLCVRSPGPLSPSYQTGRYDHPWGGKPGSVKDLFARAGRRLPATLP